MQQITPPIRLMTPEETRAARLANAGRVIVLDGTTIPIEAGRSDQVHVFKDSTVLYVLSINDRHEYLGFEIFDATSGESYYSLFLQGPEELGSYLGVYRRWLNPRTIIRKLKHHLA